MYECGHNSPACHCFKSVNHARTPSVNISKLQVTQCTRKGLGEELAFPIFPTQIARLMYAIATTGQLWEAALKYTICLGGAYSTLLPEAAV